jgi:hypothetical protein
MMMGVARKECVMKTQDIVTAVATVFGAVVGAVLAALAPGILARWKPSGLQQHKCSYLKMYSLSRKAAGAPPLYQRHVDRLNQDIDVYDEVHLFRLNVFHKQQMQFATRDRSDGVVDLRILHPWQEEINYPDKAAAKIPGLIVQAFEHGSSVFLTQTIRYNGFQPGGEDMLTQMEGDAEEVRMIMDFSSLPNIKAVLNGNPKATLWSAQDKSWKEIKLTEPHSNVYLVEQSKLRKDDVIKVEFPIDWDKVDQGKHR